MYIRKETIHTITRYYLMSIVEERIADINFKITKKQIRVYIIQYYVYHPWSKPNKQAIKILITDYINKYFVRNREKKIVFFM